MNEKYLIRADTLAELMAAISQSKVDGFPILRFESGSDLYFINHQTLVKIADVVRASSGEVGEIPVTDLAGKILTLGGDVPTPDFDTIAILGKAVLGRAILGATLPKLGTPFVWLSMFSNSLARPTIYLKTVEDDEPDEPIVTPKLATPTIRLDVVEDEVEPDEPIVTPKLATPAIRLHEVIDDIVFVLDAPVIRLYEETYANCEHKDYTYETTRPVTCTEDGIITYTCNVCGYQWTNTLSSAGHYYKSAVTDPTCTTGGYTTHTCVDCGDSYIDNETDALGHAWGEPYYGSEFATGYGRKCERCEELESMPVPTEKLATPTISLETVEDAGETVVVFDGELTAMEHEYLGLVIRFDGELLSADVKHYTLSIDGVATKLSPATSYMWAEYNLSVECVYLLYQTDGEIMITADSCLKAGETHIVRITYNTDDCVPFLFKPNIKLETIA